MRCPYQSDQPAYAECSGHHGRAVLGCQRHATSGQEDKEGLEAFGKGGGLQMAILEMVEVMVEMEGLNQHRYPPEKQRYTSATDTVQLCSWVMSLQL